jgi:hypothetical protein
MAAVKVYEEPEVKVAASGDEETMLKRTHPQGSRKPGLLPVKDQLNCCKFSCIILEYGYN